MWTYHLRIITDSCSQEAETALNLFLQSIPAVSELHMEAFQPYWKNPKQGDLLCSFRSSHPVQDIQAILAGQWSGDVADIRWSIIHVPHAVFIWINPVTK